jgi:hypothetical protein
MTRGFVIASPGRGRRRARSVVEPRDGPTARAQPNGGTIAPESTRSRARGADAVSALAVPGSNTIGALLIFISCRGNRARLPFRSAQGWHYMESTVTRAPLCGYDRLPEDEADHRWRNRLAPASISERSGEHDRAGGRRRHARWVGRTRQAKLRRRRGRSARIWCIWLNPGRRRDTNRGRPTIFPNPVRPASDRAIALRHYANTRGLRKHRDTLSFSRSQAYTFRHVIPEIDRSISGVPPI